MKVYCTGDEQNEFVADLLVSFAVILFWSAVRHCGLTVAVNSLTKLSATQLKNRCVISSFKVCPCINRRTVTISDRWLKNNFFFNSTDEFISLYVRQKCTVVIKMLSRKTSSYTTRWILMAPDGHRGYNQHISAVVAFGDWPCNGTADVEYFIGVTGQVLYISDSAIASAVASSCAWLEDLLIDWIASSISTSVKPENSPTRIFRTCRVEI